VLRLVRRLADHPDGIYVHVRREQGWVSLAYADLTPEGAGGVVGEMDRPSCGRLGRPIPRSPRDHGRLPALLAR
jgi:hypothetical protein